MITMPVSHKGPLAVIPGDIEITIYEDCIIFDTYTQAYPEPSPWAVVA